MKFDIIRDVIIDFDADPRMVINSRYLKIERAHRIAMATINFVFAAFLIGCDSWFSPVGTYMFWNAVRHSMKALDAHRILPEQIIREVYDL